MIEEKNSSNRLIHQSERDGWSPFSMQHVYCSGLICILAFRIFDRAPLKLSDIHEENDTSKIVAKSMNRRAFFEGLHKGESDTSFHFIQCYQSVHQQTDFWRGTIITLNLNIIFREPKEPSLKCLLASSASFYHDYKHLLTLGKVAACTGCVLRFNCCSSPKSET